MRPLDEATYYGIVISLTGGGVVGASVEIVATFQPDHESRDYKCRLRLASHVIVVTGTLRRMCIYICPDLLLWNMHCNGAHRNDVPLLYIYIYFFFLVYYAGH